MKEKQQDPGGARRRAGLALISFALAVAAVPGLNANTTKNKPSEVPARVIAHIPLSTAPGNEMLLQTRGDKHYLYIQTAAKDGFMVVDVRKPEFPALLDRQVKGNDPTAGSLQVIGADVAVAAVPDKGSKSSTVRSAGSPTETVKILDLSDPAHPKVIQTFKNVTGMVGDAGRGILYVANDEGLWVLKHDRHYLTPAREKKPCDSYSAIAAMPPDCQ